jgi:hypothetical protein
MTEKRTWILVAGALALTAGCGNSDKGKNDTGIKPEQSVTLPEGGPQADKKITPTTDGPATGGWGDKCDKTCPGGSFTCVPVMTGTTAGFCTKECPLADEGKQCAGAAGGQFAGCIIPADAAKSKLYCGFICQTKDNTGKVVTFACPSQLTCGDENPPGSGQKVCVP